MVNEKSGAERIIEQINSTNAKKAAIILVIGFAIYHELLHLRYGNTHFFGYVEIYCLLLFN